MAEPRRVGRARRRCRPATLLFLAALAPAALLSIANANELRSFREPDLAETLNASGLACEAKQDHDCAIGYFDRAIRLKPGFVDALVNRGDAYSAKGAYGRAIQDYSRAIRLQPANANAFNGRGSARLGKNDYGGAIADFGRAIALVPSFVQAYNNRGITHTRKGDHDAALADFNAAIARKPNYAKAYGNRGYVYFKVGQYESAISDAEEALRLDPTQSWVAGNLREARDAKHLLRLRSTAVSSGSRVALVIGNSSYVNFQPLPNAAHDAADVAAALKKHGYSIHGFPKTDFGKQDLIAEVDAFRKVSAGASAAIVWYAGHGQQMREDDSDIPVDWIIPVNADVKRHADMAPNAIRLDDLKISVLAAKALRLVVIDACRNDALRSTSGLTRGFNRYIRIPGVLVVYSTQPGKIAQDGEGRNSPFAQAFLDVLQAKPKQDVRLFFGAVKGSVLQLTNNRQEPRIEDGIGTGDVLTLVP